MIFDWYWGIVVVVSMRGDIVIIFGSRDIGNGILMILLFIWNIYVRYFVFICFSRII